MVRAFGSLLVLILLSALWASSALGQRGKPEGLYYKSWAIVIAIDDYLIAPKRTGNVKDAKAVADAFRQLGFEEVIEIYDKQAKSKQLFYILEDFLPRKVGRMDRLVIFFAGHAGVAKDMDGEDVGYLVPWDVQIGNVQKSLTLHQLKSHTHRIMSKHILVFLDTSVSDWQVTPPQQLSLEGRMAPEDVTERRAVQLLSAAQAGEPVVRLNGRGLFVDSLVRGLQGESDQDENGWIFASELAAYVESHVTHASDGAQHPQFARLDGDGDMILREGRRGPHGGFGEPRTEAERQAAARTLYGQAMVSLQNQKPPSKALDLLNQALTYDSTYGDAYVLKAFILLEMVPDLDGAMVAALHAVEYAPENPDSHFTFGLILQRKGMYPEAERAYLEALEVNPSNGDVYLILGDLYADDLKDSQKAGGAYQRYLELGGSNRRAGEYLGQSGAGNQQPLP